MSGVRIPVRSPLILGISQVGKAHDFDSCMRRFESCIPSHINDSLAQSVEHLTFNQGVRSSNLRWVTNIWRHDQVAKVEDCNSFIPSSNLGVASKYSKVAQWWSTRLLTDRLRVRVPPLEPRKYAEVAELADAQDLKSCETYTFVPVRFRSSAPYFMRDNDNRT